MILVLFETVLYLRECLSVCSSSVSLLLGSCARCNAHCRSEKLTVACGAGDLLAKSTGSTRSTYVCESVGSHCVVVLCDRDRHKEGGLAMDKFFVFSGGWRGRASVGCNSTHFVACGSVRRRESCQVLPADATNQDLGVGRDLTTIELFVATRCRPVVQVPSSTRFVCS